MTPGDFVIVTFDTAKLGPLVQLRVQGGDVLRGRRLEGQIVAEAPFEVIGLRLCKEAGGASPHVVHMQDRQASCRAERLGALGEADSRVEPVEGTGTHHRIELLTRQRPRFKRTRLNVHVGKPLEVSSGQGSQVGTEFYR